MKTTRHPARGRLLDVALVLGLFFGVLLTACGPGSSGGGQGTSTITRQDREAAETNLRKIGTTMDELVQAYKAGNRAEAQKLAQEATELYEGPTEHVMSSADSADNRQLDPLLMATLPQKVKDGAPASDVESTANRAKSLCEQALKKLQESE